MTITVSEASMAPMAARTAPPVPSDWVCTAVSVPSGSADERSRAGEMITHTRSAPASRAASTGQATIGRPHTECSIFGTDERIRVPSPAAMISTVGPLTYGIVERRSRYGESGTEDGTIRADPNLGAFSRRARVKRHNGELGSPDSNRDNWPQKPGSCQLDDSPESTNSVDRTAVDDPIAASRINAIHVRQVGADCVDASS